MKAVKSKPVTFELNKVYCEDCLVTMGRMPDDFIDMVVTSPPYDNMRTFDGNFRFDFESIAKEIFRVLKPGGVLVWIVADETKKFCESLTSFKQAIYFVEQTGFNLLDTMVYEKAGFPPTYKDLRRYKPLFEYMFVLVKGKKPKIFNPIVDVPVAYSERRLDAIRQRQADGSMKQSNRKPGNMRELRMRSNVWRYSVGWNKDTDEKIVLDHPGRFPERLARDHIVSWSNEGDLVYDPFMGSGTTAKACIILKRKYLGSEISKKYFNLIQERLKSFSVRAWY